jgi:hypothetical protein
MTRCSAWNGSRAFSKYLVHHILLVTSADESRRQTLVCPPVYAPGLALSPCGAVREEEVPEVPDKSQHVASHVRHALWHTRYYIGNPEFLFLKS